MPVRGHGDEQGFVSDHGQFDYACRVCTTPEECDVGGCLAFDFCPDCTEREDQCRCDKEAQSAG